MYQVLLPWSPLINYATYSYCWAICHLLQAPTVGLCRSKDLPNYVKQRANSVLVLRNNTTSYPMMNPQFDSCPYNQWGMQQAPSS